MILSKQIKGLVFGLFSPEDIKKMASVKLVTPELYDKEGYPVDGGLMDIRLGVIDPGLRCKTCGSKLKECVGHFGYIDLARPIVHLNYARSILDALNSTCVECGRVVADLDKIKKYMQKLERYEKEKKNELRKREMKLFSNALKNAKKCPYCNAKQAKIVLDKPTAFSENERKLSPIEIRLKLEKITDDDASLLGFNPKYARPEWMILTTLPIPPVTTRPSITLETGERSEDDLTHKLSDIVRINQRLFENINAGAPEVIIEDLWKLLQYHVTTYFDNTVTQVPPARHRSGQPLKTLAERIKSKEGRFRHNLAGKRVNFAARTVISPDPKIKFNEVGVPETVAIELTVPTRVTEWNINWLKELIKNRKYPSANYIVRPDGKKKKITDETVDQLIEELQPGYIVERHLVDGDVALFNRQPSLHRMSIMCHKVRILPGKSFRLNPSVCNPYNADFDGDEMNLHVPQKEEAIAEADMLMQVKSHIITPKNGLNIIGCIEDTISGNFLLTKRLKFSREEAIGILLAIGVTDFSKLGKDKIVDGKSIFSALLPNDFNFIGYSKECKKMDRCLKTKCPIDAYVLIENGRLISGVIDKNSIGEDNGAILRALHAKYGEDITVNVLEKIFKLGIEVLLRHGFTTAISDTDLPLEVIEKIKEAIKAAEKKVQDLIKEYEEGKMEALPGVSLKDTLEMQISKTLNHVRNDIGKFISSYLSEDNPTVIMIKSGATASILNIVQMASCVGQQVLRGKRIQRGYRNRTLSLFKTDDLGPVAHGFIERGYKNGLSPAEFFWGAMTGRDSLMDTALRTPKSGYLYRRLANALQDIKVEYDSTVRDANNNIIQFNYGDDNIDVSKSEGGKINVKKIVEEVSELQ